MACEILCDRQFQNVLLLSISFMLVFTAFQTLGNIEQTVLDSIKQDDTTLKGDGYTSLAVIYTLFSLSNWIAPSIVSILRPKMTMVFGAVLYTAFIASFLYPRTWLLYLMSSILGIGASSIWTAQGNYLTLCSNEQTMSRNSGIFWAILQMSMFLGNLFVYFQFDGKSHIDQHTRIVVFSALTGVAIIGIFFLLLLRRPDIDNTVVDLPREGPVSALKKSVKLFTERNMILLAFVFFYTGIELSFFSGVYSSSIGFTNQIGTQAKKLVGLCGIVVGIGEVLGGALFGLFGSKTVKYGRDPIVLLGFLCHTLCFYLIFINLPDKSPFGATDDLSFLHPQIAWLAMLCAFLLGFGDACFNTQIYSILGGLYPQDSAPAFALFKFTQSGAAAASFFYSSVFSLRLQLGILQFFCILGSYAFFRVEWDTSARIRDEISAAESCMDDEEDDEERYQ